MQLDYNMSEVLSVNEVMEILYIGRNTAYKLLRAGELKGFKIGKTWKIPKSAVIDFIISRST